MGYITVDELRNILRNDFDSCNPEQLQGVIESSSAYMDNYMGISYLNGEKEEERVKFARIESYYSYLRPKTKNISLVSEVVLKTISGDEYDIEDPQVDCDDYIVIIPPVCVNERDYCYVRYTSGYESEFVPTDLKTACAYICRQFLKMGEENGFSGLDAITSTIGGKLQSFKNREYQEKYGDSNQEFLNQSQIMGNYREIDIAYQILDKYREIY